MSSESSRLNSLYLTELQDAGPDTTLGRIRSLWWPVFLERFSLEGAAVTINSLDSCMDACRDELQQIAIQYARQKGHREGSAKFTQLVSQFLKSNTGKMFERFVGLTLAHCLNSSGSDYCIQPFRSDTLNRCSGFSSDTFEITVRLGETAYTTKIDSDLIAFNPTDNEKPIYMISIKSTLKDRFHNVPFWNILRVISVAGVRDGIRARHPEILSKMQYIAICTDLAAEQPDFSNAEGPRNLLCLDAALLDGAYVTASTAQGLGTCTNHIGPLRGSPFYPLSAFLSHITVSNT
jgi:hypothetical protein